MDDFDIGSRKLSIFTLDEGSRLRCMISQEDGNGNGCGSGIGTAIALELAAHWRDGDCSDQSNKGANKSCQYLYREKSPILYGKCADGSDGTLVAFAEIRPALHLSVTSKI